MALDIRSALEKTLDDRKLSRGERQALASHLGELELDANAVALHLNQAFELARSRLNDLPSRELLEWVEDVVKTFRTAEQRALPPVPRGGEVGAFFSPGSACLDEIRRQIRNARGSLRICVFTVTDDRITSELLAAHRRGVQMRLITDDDKSYDKGSDVDRMREEGIAVRVDDSPFHMHHKYAVADGRVLLNGSYNWTRSAAEVNEENLLVTDDPRLVKPFIESFDTLWDRLSR